MTGIDPFDLARFVSAQEPVYARVLAELRRGQKETHWIWFIFPQLKGLGRSATAEHFGIVSREEALAYIGHDLLRGRLIECTSLVLKHAGTRIEHIFPYPDHLKVHSSMTLFADVAPAERVLAKTLDVFFDGKKDEKTRRLLRQLPAS